MKWHLGCALLFTFACTACGGGSESAEPTTTSDQASVTASTTPSSTTSSTLFIFNEDPPPLENTGEDFEQILSSLFSYRAWLFANPDPSLVDNAFEPGSSSEEAATRILTEDQQLGRFTSAPGVEIPTEVRVSDRPDDDTVLLFVTRPDLGYTVTNSSGEVFETVEPGPEVSAIYELRRSDGRWRLASFTRLSG